MQLMVLSQANYGKIRLSYSYCAETGISHASSNLRTNQTLNKIQGIKFLVQNICIVNVEPFI